MNKEIIPACMPKEFDEIADVARSVVSYVETIQIDIMDGKYVPEQTWPFLYKNDYHINNLIKESEGFPLWDKINYELDLMVERPELNLDTWLNIGAFRIIFHYQSVLDWKLIEEIDQVNRNFIEIGIAITIHDNLEEIFPLIENHIVDFVQVMGISNIGYMGEPFDNRSIDIIRELRDRYSNLTISIDGGVSKETIPLLRDSGVTRFVSGSGIFLNGMVMENIENFKNIINE